MEEAINTLKQQIKQVEYWRDCSAEDLETAREAAVKAETDLTRYEAKLEELRKGVAALEAAQ